MKYKNGRLHVVVVSEDDPVVGLYAPSGATRVTVAQGPGVYAPNGALRIQSASTSPAGVYNADGNIMVFGTNTNDGIYRPNGSLAITT